MAQKESVARKIQPEPAGQDQGIQVSTQAGFPILFELDKKSWTSFIDKAEAWFGTVQMTQAMFRKMLEDTVGKIKEPHIRDYLNEMAKTARRHEEQAEKLFQIIGRQPHDTKKLLGVAMAKAQEVFADLVGLASGGAVGGWKDLRQLMILNLEAIGAFGIAEQMGLALGIPEIVDIAFPIVNEKKGDQLLLQEYMLEMGPVALLYKQAA